MSNYTKTTNFTAKDALTTGDPDKLIKGSLFDTEFDAIASAITSKYDSNNLASQAQAQAGSSNSVLMTPLRTQEWGVEWAGENGGMIADIQALADPGADRILFWDDSAGAASVLTVSTGLTLSGTSLTVNEGGVNHDNLSGFVANEHINHANVSITAGDGLTGGGTIAATRELNVGAGDGISVTADAVAVDSTVVRTSGNQTIGGTKTFSANISMSGTRAIDATTRLNLTGATVSVGESGGSLGFYGSAGGNKQTVTGTDTPALGTTMRSLLQALDNIGLINFTP